MTSKYKKNFKTSRDLVSMEITFSTCDRSSWISQLLAYGTDKPRHIKRVIRTMTQAIVRKPAIWPLATPKPLVWSSPKFAQGNKSWRSTKMQNFITVQSVKGSLASLWATLHTKNKLFLARFLPCYAMPAQCMPWHSVFLSIYLSHFDTVYQNE